MHGEYAVIFILPNHSSSNNTARLKTPTWFAKAEYTELLEGNAQANEEYILYFHNFICVLEKKPSRGQGNLAKKYTDCVFTITIIVTFTFFWRGGGGTMTALK